MTSSYSNSNKVILILYALIALFYVISLLSLPVGYDESKYYIVSKYVDMGRVPWMDIHPGSVGTHFYQIYDLWFNFFGNSFYSARGVSIVLSILSILSVVRLFKLLRLHIYAIIAWIIVYALNPFYGYLNVIVSHVSITHSLILISVSCQIQLMLHLKRNVINNKVILIAIVAGITIASAILIRPYFLIAALALFVFLSYYTISSKRYILLITFIVSSLLTILGSVYVQSVSEAKYNYLQSLPLEEKQIQIEEEHEVLEQKFQEVKPEDEIKIEAITKNIEKLIEVVETQNQKIEKDVQIEEVKIKEERVVLNLGLPAELSHRLDTLNTMLGEASQSLERMLALSIINPMLRQLAGYMVNPLFIFYLVGVFCIPYLIKNGYKIIDLQIVKIIIIVSASILLPLLIFRYSKNASFTYLVHGVSLLSLTLAFTLSSILNKGKSKTNILETSLLGILAIFCIQTHIFLTPSNYIHNPLNIIIKSFYQKAGEDSYSIRTAKEIAKIIDNNTLPGDHVLFDQYAPLVFSKAQAIPGIEMSIHDNFFDKKNWIDVKILYKHESNPVGRSAREVLNYIENGDVPLIVTSGRTSKDLIEIIDGVYCPISNYGKYVIYNMCQVADLK
jgi:DNA-binding protein